MDKSQKRAHYTSSDKKTSKAKDRDDIESLRRSLELLRAVNRVLSQASDESSLLNAFCQQIAQIGGYPIVWIGYAQNDAQKKVKPVAKAGKGKERVETANVTWDDTPAGRGPTGTAIQTKQAVVSRDIHSDPFFDGWQNKAIEEGYTSSIAVPIIHQEEVLGSLNIYSDKTDAFNSEEIALLQEVAHNLATAIRNIRAQAASQAQAKALEQSYQIQAALNSLLMLGLQDLPCSELAQQALETILSLPWLKIESKGSIFLVGDEPDMLELKTEKGLPAALKTTCARVPFGKCLCGRAAKEKKLQFASTLTPEHETTYKGIEPHGHYCVPIIIDDKVIGVLNTYIKEGHQYNEQQAASLASIANILAMTIRYRSLQEELIQNQNKLRNAMEATVKALATALEIRDPYTAGHQERVTSLATALAQELGLPTHRVEAVRIAAILHDIGKIYVPSDILNKPGRLTDLEFGLVKQHSERGYEILKNIDFPWPVAEIVRQHHERLDGSGYPRGLTGDEILLEARILAVADVVEAMSSHRPYRPALGTGAALEEIAQKSGVLYDPEVVKACLRLFHEKGFKFY